MSDRTMTPSERNQGAQQSTPAAERYQEAAQAFGKFFDLEEPYPSKEDFKIAASVLSKLASGWVLVPAEPTQTMIAEAGAYDRADRAHSGWSADWGGIYRAMIAAAPDVGGTT